jgi:hypothetical protein
MRFYKTRRLRIISGASLLLILTGTPVLLGLTRPADGVATEAPGIVRVYASGISSMEMAGLAALGFAVMFALWLLAGQRQEVNRRFLGKNARRRHNAVATLHTLATVIGAAGLIVGNLSGLYAAMIHARPDVYNQLPLPFLTAELALIGLLGGGALYAAARFRR